MFQHVPTTSGDDAFQASRQRTIAALDSYIIDGVRSPTRVQLLTALKMA